MSCSENGCEDRWEIGTLRISAGQRGGVMCSAEQVVGTQVTLPCPTQDTGKIRSWLYTVFRDKGLDLKVTGSTIN